MSCRSIERACPGAVQDLVPAESAGLVTLQDGRVEFSHVLARSAVYGAAPPEERRAAHRALAGALPDRDADRRAWHLALATVGPDEPASSALEQAGGRAYDRSAYDVAAAAFERAAALSLQPARLVYRGADAAWLAGQADRAISLLDAAEPGTDDLRLTLAIEHLRGQITARRGPVRLARSILADAAERAAASDPELAVVMLAEATMLSFYAGDALAMVVTAGRATELAAELDGRAPILAGLAYGMALVFAGEGDSGARSIRSAVARLEASDELRDDPYLAVWAAHGPLWLREAEAGRGLYERALALVRSRAALGAIPELLVHVARDWATTDEWPAAHAAYSEAVALARETGQDVSLAFGLAGLAWLEARQGREAECRAHAAEGREAGIRAGVTCTSSGRSRRSATSSSGSAGRRLLSTTTSNGTALLAASGIEDTDLSPGARAHGDASASGAGRRGGDTCSSARAERPRQGSAMGARPCGSHPWPARGRRGARAGVRRGDRPARTDSGRLRGRADTPRLRCAPTARRPARQRAEELRSAIEAFDSLGAEPWSNLARVELEATGETARKRDPSTLDQLTPQELQIALLLADGRTTREAAASMFLSPKTIEYHLRNVYRKLGVHSRPELSEAMTRLR